MSVMLQKESLILTVVICVRVRQLSVWSRVGGSIRTWPITELPEYALCHLDEKDNTVEIVQAYEKLLYENG